MIPIKLVLSGFLSYRDPAELDFTGFDLACIAGENGAGKSSLLDAITYALFGKARKSDESLINAQSLSASVALTFAYEGNVYRVLRNMVRGKTTIVEFQIASTPPGSIDNRVLPDDMEWKVLTERTIRNTQGRIEDLLRMDYETFVNASFFLQGKADQFTQQRPGERRRLLSAILGLEVWERYQKQASERRKALEARITAIDGRLQEIHLELEEEGQRRAKLAEIEATLERLARLRGSQETVLENMRMIQAALQEQQRLLDSLRRQRETSQERMNGLQAKLAELLDEQSVFTATLGRAAEIRAGFARLEGLRMELAARELTAEQFRLQEARRSEPLAAIREEKARLETEHKSLLENGNRIERSQAQRDDLKKSLVELQAVLEGLATLLAGKTKLEERLQVALEERAEAQAENPRLKLEMDTLKKRIDQLGATDDSRCPLCGQPLTEEHRRTLIAELNDQGIQKGNQYRSNRKLLEAADERVKSIQLEINSYRAAEDDQRLRSQEKVQIETRLHKLEDERAEWKSQGARRLKELTRNLKEEKYAKEARLELARIDAELKTLGYDAAGHDQLRREVAAGREVEEQLRTLERADAALAPLQRNIADVEAQAAVQRADNERQDGELNLAQAEFDAAQRQAPDLYQAQQELLDVQEQENRARMDVGYARQRVEVLADLRDRKARLEGERADQALKVARYRQLEQAFGAEGIPQVLIESALPQIERRANEVLDRLSAGQMSVSFQTQRPLKSGEGLRETLEIQISDNAGTRDYEMYSGGEAFRVNFAIRLALSKVLAQRSGARLQTLVIDEGFGSQDAAGRQRLLEAISLVREDFAKILVITHLDELKDAFPARIEVRKTQLSSQIEVIAG